MTSATGERVAVLRSDYERLSQGYGDTRTPDDSHLLLGAR